ncbi:MAG: hemin uptake protein HemP [Pseudomonadota bacterium]
MQSPDTNTANALPLRPGQPVHDARALIGEDGTATILLDDKAYVLRITRAGKLILTK